MATNTTLIGSIAGAAVLAAGVLVGVLTAPSPAPATDRLTVEQTQAWKDLETIQRTISEVKEARQALVRAKARVDAAREELRSAQADLVPLQQAWPAMMAKGLDARTRWREVRKVEMPEALRGSQWAGMDRVVQVETETEETP